MSHRPVDSKRLIQQGLAYLTVTLIVGAAYFATILLVQFVFQSLAPQSSLAGAFVAAIALAVLGRPLYDLAYRTVNRPPFRAGDGHAAVLREYGQSISGITDLNELATKSVAFISKVLGVRKGALLTIEDNNGITFTFRVIPGMGAIDIVPAQMSWDHPLITYFAKTGDPVTARDIGRLPELEFMPRQDREWLYLLGMDVHVPIRAGEGLTGILALGPKGSGDLYSREDLALLRALGERTAPALNTAQRYQDLSTLSEGMAQLNEELQRLDEAKSAFLTIASHELKTPLTLIQGYATILGSLPLDELRNSEKVKHVTEGITRGTERLRQIIDDMLDISRIDANALHLQWRECTLSHIMGLVVGQLMPVVQERQQTLAIQDLENIPPFDGDPRRLYQAFHNVVENAIKYTPDGGKISISAQVVGGAAPPEQFIEVVISDTGIGIAPEDQKRIFERFCRISDTTLHSSSRVQFKGGGPGLGLAITRGIVEAHGGKIWVESEGYDEERCPGSQFHILLPVKAQEIPEKLSRRLASAK